MARKLRPGLPAPALRFVTVAQGDYDLSSGIPPGGSYVVFHRGSHCRWTRLMLKDLDDRIGDFALRGIRVAAISAEDKQACEAMAERMQIIRLPLGYGLDIRATARDWGLYLTEQSIEPDAPALHWEPAQAWIRPDATLGALTVQTGPNLWPDVTNTLRAIENTMDKYPARGAGA